MEPFNLPENIVLQSSQFKVLKVTTIKYVYVFVVDFDFSQCFKQFKCIYFIEPEHLHGHISGFEFSLSSK